MVKFGKFLRNNIIEDWEQDYIDYKTLKHFIKENRTSGK